MVAKREWVNQGGVTTSYLASDHLSSTSIVMDSSGILLRISLFPAHRLLPLATAH